MKLIGSSSRGKHAGGKSASSDVSKPAQTKHVVKSKKHTSGTKRAVIIICSVIGALLILSSAAFAVWWYRIDPFYDMLFGLNITAGDPARVSAPPSTNPDTVNNPDNSNIQIPEGPRNPDPEKSLEDLRNMNKVTILVLGVDGYAGKRSQGGGNTDAIMIVSFDMDEDTLEVVSIPRDTVVNVPWSVKKINSIWATMSNKYRNSDNPEKDTMEATKEHFSDFLGFPIDYWVRLDMEGFVSLVNALPGGGVTFKVPYRISLSEPSIGLNVNLSAGEQKLNGMQALAIIRYRGTSAGDFGRIDLQQDFLKAVADQLLANATNINPVDYANILLKHVKTDMDVSTLARLGREMLDISSDSIGFDAAPCSIYTKSSGAGAGSYVTVHLDEWLEIVNTKLSPFYDEITPLHVSILTLNENGRLYVTDDNWQGGRSW